ncbi:MAG: hypothetical protein IT184_02910 [Acidobacteria bacterium]|nr:hypothetical protein [Acidobacteriota bacterium]
MPDVRNVLLITPHFPPDASAAAHRVRLLAPYLPKYGWQPTVLTCREDAYEGALDPALAAFVPASLRVVRAPAWPVRLTRSVGIGDLGLRSFAGLRRAASALCASEPFDAAFITIFPSYTALLGPWLTRRFRVPFILDYQDPWVSAWGAEVGGRPDGGVDVKSRLSRTLAGWLEPRVVKAAAAITAVSAGTFEPVLRRNPDIQPITEAIPLGAEPQDFCQEWSPRVALPFDPADGQLHVCYTGTMLPLGRETLRAVLAAVARVRDERPALYTRLRLHFIGTSNQSVAAETYRVLPIARELGVADVVDEQPARLPYSAIVQVQQHAGALLALGSSEPHYTASKIFPLLLARRPLLAVYHEASTVADVLGAIGPSRAVALVTYGDDVRAAARIGAIYDRLLEVLDEAASPGPARMDLSGLGDYWAEALAGRLARVLDRVVDARAA